MKLLILALTFCVAFSVSGITSITVSSTTAAFVTGTTSTATCTATVTFLGTYAGMTAAAKSQNMGLWLQSSSSTTGTSSDAQIFMYWTTASTAADTLTATSYQSAPTAKSYKWGTAWALDSDIPITGATITAGATGVYSHIFPSTFSFAQIKSMSATWTKNTIPMFYWKVITETATATTTPIVQTDAAYTGAGTATFTFDITACVTGMKALETAASTTTTTNKTNSTAFASASLATSMFVVNLF